MFYQLEEMVNKKSSAKSMVRKENFDFNKKKSWNLEDVKLSEKVNY